MALRTATVSLWLALLLADCSGRDYGHLFGDAGSCSDASMDASCPP